VRNQNPEVKRAHPALAAEAHVADVVVIGEIRRQEDGGKSHRGKHARAMRPYPAVLDEDESRQQQDGGASVEERVEGSQRMISIHSGCRVYHDSRYGGVCIGGGATGFAPISAGFVTGLG